MCVYRDAKKKHVQLLKDRKMFEAKIGEMEGTCEEEMILKFGRIVDLEQLEQVTVNRQVEELKEKLRITEIECSDDLKRWEVNNFFNFSMPLSIEKLYNTDSY